MVHMPKPLPDPASGMAMMAHSFPYLMRVPGGTIEVSTIVKFIPANASVLPEYVPVGEDEFGEYDDHENVSEDDDA